MCNIPSFYVHVLHNDNGRTVIYVMYKEPYTTTQKRRRRTDLATKCIAFSLLVSVKLNGSLRTAGCSESCESNTYVHIHTHRITHTLQTHTSPLITVTVHINTFNSICSIVNGILFYKLQKLYIDISLPPSLWLIIHLTRGVSWVYCCTWRRAPHLRTMRWKENEANKPTNLGLPSIGEGTETYARRWSV